MNDDNITLFLHEKIKDYDDHDDDDNENTKNNTNLVDIEKLLEEFESLNTYNKHSFLLNSNSEKNLNILTVNQLFKICEYYNLLKNVKIAKYKKTEILNAIKYFETNPNNILIVNKRKKLWNYMEELSNDNIMKKYVIWK